MSLASRVTHLILRLVDHERSGLGSIDDEGQRPDPVKRSKPRRSGSERVTEGRECSTIFWLYAAH